MKVRFSSTSKRPYVKLNNTKYFGFRIDLVPGRFANDRAKTPIVSWFNYKGFTFLAEDNFVDLFGNITIE